jgi:hypothetical protein
MFLPLENHEASSYTFTEEPCGISWIMRYGQNNELAEGNSESSTVLVEDGDFGGFFQSIDFRSTLTNGWIPRDGVEFFSLFLKEVEKKWIALFEASNVHQNRRVGLYIYRVFVSLCTKLIFSFSLFLFFAAHWTFGG